MKVINIFDLAFTTLPQLYEEEELLLIESYVSAYVTIIRYLEVAGKNEPSSLFSNRLCITNIREFNRKIDCRYRIIDRGSRTAIDMAMILNGQ